MTNEFVWVILAAVLLDLLLGDPRWLPHPIVLIGKLISFLESLLRRINMAGRLGGCFLLAATVGITVSCAYLLLWGAAALNPLFGYAMSVFLAWSCLAARSLHRESKLVADALKQGNLPEARRFLSNIVGRDTIDLDEPEVWRGAVETVAENTSDGVIAPLFCLMLGGPLLALAYKAVNTLDSMVGYKNDRYIYFGWASARFDDLANYLPSRLTGLLMVIFAPVAGLSGKGAWEIMIRDGRNHSSPNSGFPEAAAAGALGVKLGGANRYFGEIVEKPTIGDADKPLDLKAWQGAIQLMYGAEGLLLAFWIIFSLLNKGFP